MPKLQYYRQQAIEYTDSLTVFSMYHNPVLATAVRALSQTTPGVAVELKVAPGDVSRNDVLTELSTEILSGKGPDILVLDGLPTQPSHDLLSDFFVFFPAHTQFNAMLHQHGTVWPFGCAQHKFQVDDIRFRYS